MTEEAPDQWMLNGYLKAAAFEVMGEGNARFASEFVRELDDFIEQGVQRLMDGGDFGEGFDRARVGITEFVLEAVSKWENSGRPAVDSYVFESARHTFCPKWPYC